MTEIDKEKVAARLRERAKEIDERRTHVAADDNEQRDAELADYDQHPADQGTETFEQELDQTTLAILDAQAKDVAAAMKLLEEGKYGICIVGGEEIPAARLEAVPEALRCIEHQNVYDAELRARRPTALARRPAIDSSAVGKTLVTGGNGFVGSAVVRLLAKRGDDLRLTRRRRSRWENVKDIDAETVECDVLDRAAVRRALKGVDRVFHVAGMVSMRPGDAERMYEVNVRGTRTLLEECLRKGVERVVYTSSCAAIGPAAPGGTTDERQLFTAGHLGIPYVNSKHEAEVEAFRLAAAGVPLVVVNPSYAFGRGDVYVRATALVRRFILRQIPVYVPGALNIVDVQDIARGQLLADERGHVGERYILGNRNYTFDRLFADLARLSGVEPPALRLPPAAALRLAQTVEAASLGRAPITVQEVRLASQWWTYRNAKAKRDLGWQPSPHEETLEATVDWYREREGDRILRGRRAQPLQYKIAWAALGAARRLWPMATA